MSWGVPSKPKVSNKLGIPSPREGSDGDIQVRQTGIGARLFAKIGGRWLSNKLYGNELDDPSVFMTKCWTSDVTMPSAGATAVDLVKMPDYITKENILGGTALVFAATNWVFSMNYGDVANSYECIFMITATAGDNMIRVAQVGSTVATKEARITVFFK